MGVNYLDIFFKVLWTGVAASLAVAITATTSLTQWWAPMLAMAFNTGLAWVRQQLGQTPPSVGPPA